MSTFFQVQNDEGDSFEAQVDRAEFVEQVDGADDVDSVDGNGGGVFTVHDETQEEDVANQGHNDQDEEDEDTAFPLTQPRPVARNHSEPEETDDGEPPLKQRNLRVTHFFNDCKGFTFTNCKFNF